MEGDIRSKAQLTLREAEETDSTPDVLTRDEIIELLTLRPCHVTGMHDPTHTTRYVCEFQKTKALERLMDVLSISYESLPRGLHGHGYWCCHPKDSVTPDPALVEWTMHKGNSGT